MKKRLVVGAAEWKLDAFTNVCDAASVSSQFDINHAADHIQHLKSWRITHVSCSSRNIYKRPQHPHQTDNDVYSLTRTHIIDGTDVRKPAKGEADLLLTPLTSFSMLNIPPVVLPLSDGAVICLLPLNCSLICRSPSLSRGPLSDLKHTHQTTGSRRKCKQPKPLL